MSPIWAPPQLSERFCSRSGLHEASPHLAPAMQLKGQLTFPTSPCSFLLEKMGFTDKAETQGLFQLRNETREWTGAQVHPEGFAYDLCPSVPGSAALQCSARLCTGFIRTVYWSQGQMLL